MPIKFKNIPATDLSDPLQKHLKDILSSSSNKEKMEYVKKKLKAACNAAELIKKNSDMPEKTGSSSDPLKTPEAKDNLTVLSTTINKPMQVNQENSQTINEYLSKQDQLRKENQLVYWKSPSNVNLNCLGLGLVENQDKFKNSFYKKKLISTDAYSFRGDQYLIRGAVEFGITYDNKIFIVPKFDGLIPNNLYKMSQGTFLKAVGCIQIGNRQLEETLVDGGTDPKIPEGQVKYISVYNTFFDVPKDNIAVSLFALQRLGVDLSDTQVVIPNDKASLISHAGCNITIHGEIKKAADYLDEIRFPGAKALAEESTTFFDKIGEIFYAIDDEVLSTRNKSLIKAIYGEKELLKLNLIKLINCYAELIKNTPKKATLSKSELGLQQGINQSSTSLQVEAVNIEKELFGIFKNYWQAVKESIQFFKEKNIDLGFLVYEINMLLAYILQNSLTSEEKNQLHTWSIPETKTPGREVNNENISSFISFYEKDPIQTCFNLFQDYSKGQGFLGFLKRVLYLAWDRRYVKFVNQVLQFYEKERPDDLTIYAIFNKLQNFGAAISLQDSKSTLLKRLLFCAKLNGEESQFIFLSSDRDGVDLDSISEEDVSLQLNDSTIQVTQQPIWIYPPIRTQSPPSPNENSPTGSTELLINRTITNSYSETSENKLYYPQRLRSSSDVKKTEKLFIAAKRFNPIMSEKEGKQVDAASSTSKGLCTP